MKKDDFIKSLSEEQKKLFDIMTAGGYGTIVLNDLIGCIKNNEKSAKKLIDRYISGFIPFCVKWEESGEHEKLLNDQMRRTCGDPGYYETLEYGLARDVWEMKRKKIIVIVEQLKNLKTNV